MYNQVLAVADILKGKIHKIINCIRQAYQARGLAA